MPTAAPPISAEPINLQTLTTLDAVNLVLVLVVCAFVYQLLQEMLFRDRGKYCAGCGLRDLPRNLSSCPACGMVLMEYLEQVGKKARLKAFGAPSLILLAALVAYNRLSSVDYGRQFVAAAYVVANAVFASIWLPGRDRRLRSLFNVAFWGAAGVVMLALFADGMLRAGMNWQVRAGVPLVDDMEIGPDGTPILSLREGALSHGIGPTSFAYFRGLQVRRLIGSGSGDVFVYIASHQISRPDALVGPTGLVWNPPADRVDIGLKLKIGAPEVAPEVRAELDRAAYQPNVDFCYAWERLWIINGKSLFRVDTAGRLETFSLGYRQLGTLLKVGIGKENVWLLAENGLTGINRLNDKKTYYPLVDKEFAVREGQNAVEGREPRDARIVSGAISGDLIWFSTSNGDIFSFDAHMERLNYQGGARSPRYLDFYGLYTLPFLILGLMWILAANFREEAIER